MDKLFVQQYFQLHSKFNDTVNYTLSSGFSGSGLIPIRGVPLFLFDLSGMDVTYNMISVNTGGIRENNRKGLKINVCKTLDTNFSIFPEAHVNFTHLHDIRELWDKEVIISPGKTQTCAVLVLAKRTAPPIEQIITDPAGRYVFFKIKHTTDAALALYAPSGTMKEPRIDKQMLGNQGSRFESGC